MPPDDAHLLDMLEAGNDARRFVAGITWDEFRDDTMRQYAVRLALQITGEAAGRVSPALRAAHPEIPWREMIAMRHRLVHDYGGIDIARVWATIQQHVPALIAAIEPLIPPPPDQ